MAGRRKWNLLNGDLTRKKESSKQNNRKYMASYPAYIPAKDALFATWLANFSALLTAAPTDYGLDAADATAVDGVNTTFQAAYTTSQNPATRTAPSVAAKDVARASAEAVVRPYAVQISRNSAVTDANKASIGVTIPSLVPTPVAAPTVAPVIGLESATIGQMRLKYQAAGASGKSKPFGAIGVEIWRSVGVVAATDPAQATYNGTVTKTPFRQNFTGPDATKICTYFARFVTRSGPDGKAQVGPWSAPLSVTVV